MADHGAAGRRLAPQTSYPSSLAEPAICRQTSKVGAVCGKAARTDLCGGRVAIRVPTAIRLLAGTWDVGPEPFSVAQGAWRFDLEQVRKLASKFFSITSPQLAADGGISGLNGLRPRLEGKQTRRDPISCPNQL